MAAIVFCRVYGKTAPAGSYLDNPVIWLQVQLLANSIQLVNGGFFKRRLLAGINRGGIHHGWIEERLKQIVAQIVVCAYVLSGAVSSVAVKPVQTLECWFGYPTEFIFKLIHTIDIAGKEPEQCRQIG